MTYEQINALPWSDIAWVMILVAMYILGIACYKAGLSEGARRERAKIRLANREVRRAFRDGRLIY